jgi:hypothetical protein
MTADEVRDALSARVHRTLREHVHGIPQSLEMTAAAVTQAVLSDEKLVDALFGEPVDLEPVDAIVVERGSSPLGAQGRRWATLALYVDGTEQARIDALLKGPVLGERFKLRMIDRKAGA